MLANSLKESVAAQTRVVDRLFDEMKELSRRIDQKNAPQPQPLPPIVVNMQQPGAPQPAGGPPPVRPIVMDLPAAQPPVEGLPRYAAADAFEEEEAPPPPPPRRSQPKARGQGQQAPQHQAPQQQARRPAPRPLAPEPPVSPEVGETRAELAAPEEPPRGWPGLGPFTDTEPEPQIAAQDEPEAELEPLDDAEPPAPGAPAAGPSADLPHEAQAPGEEIVLEEGPEPSVSAERPASAPAAGAQAPGARGEQDRDAEDVRKGLRDYLHGVQDKLDAGAEKRSGPSGLLDYLGKLSDYLPERDKKRFRGSPERLAMEALKAQLAGKKGLRRRVASDFPAVAPRRKEPMTRSLVVDTFSYLKDLSAWHPDKAVGAAMRQSIEAIVARMGRS